MKAIVHLFFVGAVGCGDGQGPADSGADGQRDVGALPYHVEICGTATIDPALMVTSGGITAIAANADLDVESILCGDPLPAPGDVARDNGSSLDEEPLSWIIYRAPMRPRLRVYVAVITELNPKAGDVYGVSRVLEPMDCGPSCFSDSIMGVRVNIDTVFPGCP